MDINDISVEVRDKTLTRYGLIPADILQIKVSPVLNGLGSWSLSLPADHPMTSILATPGAGIIVTGPTDVILSGPVTGITRVQSSGDPEGTVSFDGVDDSVILSDMLAFPQPTNANPTTQTAAHDIRTGPAETVMRAYVDANCGPSAPAPRKRANLTLATDRSRGVTVNKSARFDNLGELLASIALVGNLGFRVVQRGNYLVFEVNDRTDRSAYVRFDILNGNVTSQEVSVAPPGATQAIVAGQGDLVNRQFVAVSTPQSLADSSTWGRYIEVWVDQRQTAVVDELTQAGAEVLAGSGFTQINTKIVPTDDTTMRLGFDWNLGDIVTVVNNGIEQKSYISGYNVVADDSGVRIGLVLGDQSALSQSVLTQQVTDDLDSRVSQLEKNTGTYLGTGWTAAALLNGWVNSGGTKQTLRYRRVGNGLVEAQGIVKSGTGVIFQLPVGYRPDADLQLPIVATNSSGYASITANGNVTATGTLTGDVAIQLLFGTTIS